MRELEKQLKAERCLVASLQLQLEDEQTMVACARLFAFFVSKLFFQKK